MIVDTGVLYAAADRRDRHHKAARSILAMREPKVVPEPVVVETDWLIQDRLGIAAEVGFLVGLGEGALAVEGPTRADRARAAEILAQYRDLSLGYVDAATVAIAERLSESRIATLDRRHFSVIRPRHIRAFELLP